MTYQPIPESRALALYRNLPVTTLAIVGTIFSLLIASVTWQWERRELRSHLESQAEILQLSLEKEFSIQQHIQPEQLANLTASASIQLLLDRSLQGLSLANLEIYFWQGDLHKQPQPLALYQVNPRLFVTNVAANPPRLVGRGWLCPEFAPPTSSASGQAFRQLRRSRSSMAQPCQRSLILGEHQLSWLLLPTAQYIAPHHFWRTWSVMLGSTVVIGFLSIYLRVSQRYMLQIEQLLRERIEKADTLQTTLTELQNTQTMLVHSERMSVLGQMLAGIVHEINNPVHFIGGNLMHLKEYVQTLISTLNLYQQYYPETTPDIEDYTEEADLEFIMEDLPSLLNSMQVGTDRIVQIVHSMRNFARLDESSMKPIDVHEGIESTLLILHNRLKAKDHYPKIQILKEYGEIPPVECYSGQINQVFMNILSNAIDVLHEQYERQQGQAETVKEGQIIIQTSQMSKNTVQIRIIDNGPGIPEQIKSRIFEPFFTTKSADKGTGLGMSISYKIVVEKHGGELSCQSKIGVGTTFCINLPISQSRSQSGKANYVNMVC